MTLAQFNNLREPEQFNVLLKRGSIIAKRKSGQYEYVLYQVDSIYIELKYHRDHKTMPDVRGFTVSSRSLLPYIEHIDIAGL